MIHSSCFFKKTFLAKLHGMWSLSSLTRDQKPVSCLGSAETWTTGSLGKSFFLFSDNYYVSGFSQRFVTRDWLMQLWGQAKQAWGRGGCFPGGSDGKESACNVGDLHLNSGLGRSPGEGNGNPLQYSCLEDSMDRGAWWATVHGVTKSQT